ncbi:MAG: hypothetical protein M3Z21_14510 [Pseudomonadota bacterium]|nr:hypothetical protein [Pseudomonadota bacterium]
MELHKLGIKIFAADAERVDLLALIPVFHRWIQTYALEDLLVDVADYSHVHAGPGILLVAHEGNYGFDETGSRRGLMYYAKRELPGTLDERLAAVCRKALTACRLLEQDAGLQGQVSFRGDEIQLFANDRLAAPNTDETFAGLQPALEALLARLYPQGYTLAREADRKERFAVTVKAAEATDVETLLQRLA